MLQSFLLIDEFSEKRQQSNSSKRLRSIITPHEILTEIGCQIQSVASMNEVKRKLHDADAVLLAITPDLLPAWKKHIGELRAIPLLWWCDEWSYAKRDCVLDSEIDGMLCPGMDRMESHYAIMMAANHFFRRTEWELEREQLLSKLEERKWIDQAKRILCEIKRLSEAEAYEFLRKQAMNERKRMVDVATSIVKVYNLLQEQHKGGR